MKITIEIDEKEFKGLFGSKETKDAKHLSEFARIFDRNCKDWTDDGYYNMIYLKNLQDRCNYMLKTQGHLFLNDVYKMLLLPVTQSGQLVGWIYDENSYVDFGIYSIENNADFINGYTSDCILDFNVDGVIIDKI